MRLGDICTKIGSGATPRGGQESYKSSGIPIIRSQNVLDWSFKDDGLAYIDGKQADALSNVEVLPGDVLLNITGDSVARACMVPPEQTPARVNQHVAIVRHGDRLSPTYLLAFLQSIKPRLLSLASSGATRKALTKSVIENLEIELPDRETQSRISSVIDCIQQKIMLNARTNGYLVALAEAQYKKILAETGESRKLSDLVNILSGGTPKTKVSGYWKGGTIPFFAPGDVTASPYTLITAKRITQLGLNNCNSDLYPVNTVLLTARGTVGKVALAGRPMAMNQSCFAFSGKGVPQSCVYFLIKSAVRSLRAKANGATFAAINMRDLSIEEVRSPSHTEMLRYDDWSRPVFDRILKNEEEGLVLAALRDALLPKLMSGEIDVSKVEVPMPPNSHLPSFHT